jgi:hypothetical protein
MVARVAGYWARLRLTLAIAQWLVAQNIIACMDWYRRRVGRSIRKQLGPPR